MNARTFDSLATRAVARFLARNLIKTADLSIKAIRIRQTIKYTIAVNGVDVAECYGRRLTLRYLDTVTLPPCWWLAGPVEYKAR